jgi:hypothetical protein
MNALVAMSRSSSGSSARPAMDFSGTPKQSRRKVHTVGICPPAGQGQGQGQGQGAGELSAEDFMKSFKTHRCGKAEPHDPRLCFHYHDAGDHRRNPYVSFYMGTGNRNEFERAYHPLAYRVQLCDTPLTCLGCFCPRAHRAGELRDSDPAEYCNAHSFPLTLTLTRALPPISPVRRPHTASAGSMSASASASWDDASLSGSLSLDMSSVGMASAAEGDTTPSPLRPSTTSGGGRGGFRGGSRGGTSRPSTSDSSRPSTSTSFSAGAASRDAATVAARVAFRSECKEKDTHFASRLQQKTKGVMSAYGTAPVLGKLCCAEAAAAARDGVLRLLCSHCAAEYTAADGNMAVCCRRCTQWFCGWCRKVFRSDADSCHRHVRECAANLSADKSLYATQDEIECGQHQLRVLQLRQFLATCKRSLRPALLEELREDLRRCQISPSDIDIQSVSSKSMSSIKSSSSSRSDINTKHPS